MDCTVLIVVRDQKPELLKRAVASAKAAKPKAIIVVDDGSVQDVPESKDYELLIQAPMGVGAALDEGVRHVKTKYVATLPSDDEMSPKRLDIMLRAMREADRERLAAFSAYEEVTHTYRRRTPELEEVGREVKRYTGKPADVAHHLRTDNVIYGGTKVLATDLFQAVEHDVDLQWCGDWDWHNRVAAKLAELEQPGWLYVDEPLVTRHVLPTGLSATAARDPKAFNAERALVHQRWWKR